MEEIDPPQYYQLPIVSDITSEGLLDYIIKAPIKMITYTADEFMKFFRVANYREQISKMFLTLNSGKVPSTLYLKNKGVKTFNGRLQFNILTQTTSVALLEDLKKYPDYLGNGFLGRFCYIYDDTNDFEAIHNLHNDILKERLLNPDLVSRLEQEYLDSEDCQITEKLDMLYQYLIKNCSKLWRIIEKCKDSCLVPWSDYHSYSYEKFSDLRSKLDTASPYHKAIYDRSFTKTLKMAAIIELSHIKDSPSGWDLNTISVTQESYDEAFDFVVPETIKIIEKIDGSFGYSKEKEYTDKLLRSLKKHWTDKGSSIKKEFVCDSKNKKLVAIKRSDMMYKTGLSASTINIAIQNLQDLELIDLVTEKVNGRNTQLIVLREGA